MKYQTIRIHQKTLEQLRLIYGLTGEKMVDTLERLIAAELDRVKNENQTRLQVQDIPNKESGKGFDKNS
jgi:hypothetical protein